jgi:hypothetical protein
MAKSKWQMVNHLKFAICDLPFEIAFSGLPPKTTVGSQQKNGECSLSLGERVARDRRFHQPARAG